MLRSSEMTLVPLHPFIRLLGSYLDFLCSYAINLQSQDESPK